MECALCNNKECSSSGKDCTEDFQKEIDDLCEKEIERLKVSASVESDCYSDKTRMEEAVVFAERMNYEKIGIAFCIGLSEEAEEIHKIFANRFEVFSVCCKLCGVEKAKYNLKGLPGAEDPDVMCNPIGQARFLGKKETDINVIVGLCIGHDILFDKYSESPVTTLVVKDRKLAHNPLGYIYSNYY